MTDHANAVCSPPDSGRYCWRGAASAVLWSNQQGRRDGRGGAESCRKALLLSQRGRLVATGLGGAGWRHVSPKAIRVADRASVLVWRAVPANDDRTACGEPFGAIHEAQGKRILFSVSRAAW